MLSKIERLRQWRDLSRSVKAEDGPEVVAGRQAEEFLLRMVASNLVYKGASCFVAKRLPSHRLRRRLEVDLLVVTRKHVYLIEVKNWSGELVERGTDWVQIRRSGKEKVHPNLVEYNSSKLQTLIEILEKHHIDLPKSFFSQSVIFMNPKLRLAPAICREPTVVTRHDLDKYLQTQKGTGLGERLVHSIIEVCLDREASGIILDGLFGAMRSDQYESICRVLADIGTWDKLGLNGGKIVAGDLLDLRVAGKRIALAHTKQGDRITVKWTRNVLVGLAKALFTESAIGCLRLGRDSLPVTPSDTAKFHEVGQPTPSEVPLRDIDWILMG